MVGRLGEEEKRVKVDIEKFYRSLRIIEDSHEESSSVVRMAKRYCSDAGYFLQKGEIFTAFGCIAYAHGLLDARIKYKN